MKIDIAEMRRAHSERKSRLAGYQPAPTSEDGWWLTMENLSELREEIRQMVVVDGKAMTMITVKEMLPGVSLNGLRSFVQWALQDVEDGHDY